MFQFSFSEVVLQEESILAAVVATYVAKRPIAVCRMIKVLSGLSLQNPTLDEMFRGRAAIFRDRLHWHVNVENEREIDQYDRQGRPIYLVSLDDDNHVVGSLRVLPTSGPTMLKNEFRAFFLDDVYFDCAQTWECTRFCVHAPTAGQHFEAKGVALELLSGLCDTALSAGINAIIGVYETPMERIYRRLGWCPTLLSRSRPQYGNINCGIWEVSPAICRTLRDRLAKMEKHQGVIVEQTPARISIAERNETDGPTA